jgi:DNA segregation ATPase FtsK/SpoIIIE, S-DNA-T family
MLAVLPPLSAPQTGRPGSAHAANAVLRTCLKVIGQVENDMVLGTSMDKNGYRATMFSREDKGVFLFAGEGLNLAGSSARIRVLAPGWLEMSIVPPLSGTGKHRVERLGELTGPVAD